MSNSASNGADVAGDDHSHARDTDAINLPVPICQNAAAAAAAAAAQDVMETETEQQHQQQQQQRDAEAMHAHPKSVPQSNRCSSDSNHADGPKESTSVEIMSLIEQYELDLKSHLCNTALRQSSTTVSSAVRQLIHAHTVETAQLRRENATLRSQVMHISHTLLHRTPSPSDDAACATRETRGEDVRSDATCGHEGLHSPTAATPEDVCVAVAEGDDGKQSFAGTTELPGQAESVPSAIHLTLPVDMTCTNDVARLVAQHAQATDLLAAHEVEREQWSRQLSELTALLVAVTEENGELRRAAAEQAGSTVGWSDYVEQHSARVAAELALQEMRGELDRGIAEFEAHEGCEHDNRSHGNDRTNHTGNEDESMQSRSKSDTSSSRSLVEENDEANAAHKNDAESSSESEQPGDADEDDDESVWHSALRQLDARCTSASSPTHEAMRQSRQTLTALEQAMHTLLAEDACVRADARALTFSNAVLTQQVATLLMRVQRLDAHLQQRQQHHHHPAGGGYHCRHDPPQHPELPSSYPHPVHPSHRPAPPTDRCDRRGYVHTAGAAENLSPSPESAAYTAHPTRPAPHRWLSLDVDITQLPAFQTNNSSSISNGALCGECRTRSSASDEGVQSAMQPFMQHTSRSRIAALRSLGHWDVRVPQAGKRTTTTTTAAAEAAAATRSALLSWSSCDRADGKTATSTREAPSVTHERTDAANGIAAQPDAFRSDYLPNDAVEQYSVDSVRALVQRHAELLRELYRLRERVHGGGGGGAETRRSEDDKEECGSEARGAESTVADTEQTSAATEEEKDDRAHAATQTPTPPPPSSSRSVQKNNSPALRAMVDALVSTAVRRHAARESDSSAALLSALPPISPEPDANHVHRGGREAQNASEDEPPPEAHKELKEKDKEEENTSLTVAMTLVRQLVELCATHTLHRAREMRTVMHCGSPCNDTAAEAATWSTAQQLLQHTVAALARTHRAVCPAATGDAAESPLSTTPAAVRSDRPTPVEEEVWLAAGAQEVAQLLQAAAEQDVTLMRVYTTAQRRHELWWQQMRPHKRRRGAAGRRHAARGCAASRDVDVDVDVCGDDEDDDDDDTWDGYHSNGDTIDATDYTDGTGGIDADDESEADHRHRRNATSSRRSEPQDQTDETTTRCHAEAESIIESHGDGNAEEEEEEDERHLSRATRRHRRSPDTGEDDDGGGVADHSVHHAARAAVARALREMGATAPVAPHRRAARRTGGGGGGGGGGNARRAAATAQSRLRLRMRLRAMTDALTAERDRHAALCETMWQLELERDAAHDALAAAQQSAAQAEQHRHRRHTADEEALHALRDQLASAQAGHRHVQCELEERQRRWAAAEEELVRVAGRRARECAALQSRLEALLVENNRMHERVTESETALQAVQRELRESNDAGAQARIALLSTSAAPTQTLLRRLFPSAQSVLEGQAAVMESMRRTIHDSAAEAAAMRQAWTLAQERVRELTARLDAEQRRRQAAQAELAQERVRVRRPHGRSAARRAEECGDADGADGSDGTAPIDDDDDDDNNVDDDNDGGRQVDATGDSTPHDRNDAHTRWSNDAQEESSHPPHRRANSRTRVRLWKKEVVSLQRALDGALQREADWRARVERMADDPISVTARRYGLQACRSWEEQLEQAMQRVAEANQACEAARRAQQQAEAQGRQAESAQLAQRQHNEAALAAAAQKYNESLSSEQRRHEDERAALVHDNARLLSRLAAVSAAVEQGACALQTESERVRALRAELTTTTEKMEHAEAALAATRCGRRRPHEPHAAILPP